MNEFDIKILEANGYSYIDGGITDRKGNYHFSIDLNGKKYKSESDKELWNRGQKLEKIHSKSKASFKNDLLLKNILNNLENDAITSVNKKKTLENANTQLIIEEPKPLTKVIYKYPLVLVTSLVVYVIIKKIIK